MQAARRKLEADHAARDRVAWTEHVATRLMAEALAAQPPTPPPAPEPKQRPIAEPAPVAEPPLTGWRLSRRLAETDPAMLRRDDAAIARIAGLAPGNTAEADIAAQYGIWRHREERTALAPCRGTGQASGIASSASRAGVRAAISAAASAASGGSK